MIGHTRFPVVGVGAVASTGARADRMYANLCAGVSGLAPMRAFNPAWYTTGHLFEIDDRGPGGDVPGRATRFLVDALGQALDDAGMPAEVGDIPVIIGSGIRETRSFELWYRDGAPFDGDLHFGVELRRRFGAVDTHTLANACCASLYALAAGTDLLAAGQAETVLVAGTDAIAESMLSVTDRVQNPPPDTVRPFDADRCGTLQGEGAAALVLRRTPRPGERVYGWIRGVGINCDAYHPTAPDAASIARAIRDAHARAGVEPADIDLVVLHGTGTYANDEAEATAMSEVFGVDLDAPLATALKSMLGHTSGTAGLHSLVAVLYAMRHSVIPPTPTLRRTMERATRFRFVRETGVTAPVSLAQVNAFGFGGVNAVAIVESAS